MLGGGLPQRRAWLEPPLASAVLTISTTGMNANVESIAASPPTLRRGGDTAPCHPLRFMASIRSGILEVVTFHRPAQEDGTRNFCKVASTLTALIAMLCLSPTARLEAGIGDALDISKLPPPTSGAVDFTRDIFPVFEKSCLRCHGSERPKGRFSLSTREAALKGGEDGVAIVPGQSAKSRLIHYVGRLVDEKEMPPVGKGDPLTPEQIGKLRAWIDQGADWPADAPGAGPVTLFSISPMVQSVHVSGNARRFREQTGLRDGWVGGASEFHFEERRKPGEKFTVDGGGFADAGDYRIRLDYEKADVGFVRGGYEQYRRYYDDTGGFYGGFAESSHTLGRDLALDIGRAWFDVGLTLPDRPRMVFGYEYQFKEGAKSSLAWGNVVAPDFQAAAIYPSFKEINEKAHILKFDVSHAIGGVALEDNLRVEFYDLATGRVYTERDYANADPASVFQETSYRAGEAYEHVDVVNALRGERELRDWLMVSGGYLYSKLDAKDAFTIESFAPPDPASVFDAGGPITLRHESHVFNANTRLGPWEELTFNAGLQNEWTREDGLGLGTLAAGGRRYSSSKGMAALAGEFGVRYTKIPHSVVYADTRVQQEWIDHHERDILSVSSQDFLRDTDATEKLSQYRAGFTVSPWTPVLFESNFKHRVRDSAYNHLTDTVPPADAALGYFPPRFFPPNSAGNGYPAFITSREIESDAVEAKLTLRPLPWLKTTLKYQIAATDYRGTTDGSFALAPVRAVQPGGGIFSGNDDSQTFTFLATVTPWRRFHFTTSISYTDSRIVTGANERAGVVPYSGDIYSVLTTTTFLLNDRTDWTASHSFSMADYGRRNDDSSLPTGIVYDRHALLTGFNHRFRKNLTGHLQYGFFRYGEPSSGTANDYVAHAVIGGLSMVFK
jgi:mono/diheme cytochrome c family protein